MNFLCTEYSVGKITEFQPYSKYPATQRSVSLWMDDVEVLHENDFCAIVR